MIHQLSEGIATQAITYFPCGEYFRGGGGVEKGGGRTNDCFRERSNRCSWGWREATCRGPSDEGGRRERHAAALRMKEEEGKKE